MALVLVTGQLTLLVTVLLAPSRRVSMTLCEARRKQATEAEEASRQEASRHLFASQQNRLHAWRRMGCEKRNIKREMSKEREKLFHLHTTLTASKLPMPLMPLSPPTTTLTLQCVCAFIRMPQTWQVLQRTLALASRADSRQMQEHLAYAPHILIFTIWRT
jgi:hypothetical protein